MGIRAEGDAVYMLLALLLIIAIGTICIVCFYVGAKVGQQVSKGEPIKMPEINPIKDYREREERKASADEQVRIETIMKNIERYDGTERGQMDVKV